MFSNGGIACSRPRRGACARHARRQHDVLNLWLIGALNVLNAIFLLRWSSGVLLAVGSFLYFSTDAAFVVLHPDCVKAPYVIVGHHLLALSLIVVPILKPE